MARDLTVIELLGALVATNNLTLADTIAISDYAAHAAEYHEPAESLESALDMALDFFNDAPDVEAAKQAERVESAAQEHDPDACPDCGGELMDEADYQQAIELWSAVRGVVDKYAFDREYYDGSRGESEEC